MMHVATEITHIAAVIVHVATEIMHIAAVMMHVASYCRYSNDACSIVL